MSEIQCKVVFVKEEYFNKNSILEEMLDPNDIVKQTKRQYLFLEIQYKDNNILIPLRSNLPSDRSIGDIGYPVPSGERPNAGLDFRKTLIVNELSYIEIPESPRIPRSQQQIIEQNYSAIKNKVIQYIEGYIRSALKNRQRRDKKYKFSTLHNFHDELGIIEALAQKKEREQQVAAANKKS